MSSLHHCGMSWSLLTYDNFERLAETQNGFFRFRCDAWLAVETMNNWQRQTCIQYLALMNFSVFQIKSTHWIACPIHWYSIFFQWVPLQREMADRLETLNHWTARDEPVSATLCRCWASFQADRTSGWWWFYWLEHEQWTGQALTFDAHRRPQRIHWCQTHSYICSKKNRTLLI